MGKTAIKKQDCKIKNNNFDSYGWYFIKNIVKLGNHCALKLELATKALFTGLFSCYLFLNVPHDQDCIKTQAYDIKI